MPDQNDTKRGTLILFDGFGHSTRCEVEYRGEFPPPDRHQSKKARRIISIDAAGVERILKNTDGFAGERTP